METTHIKFWAVPRTSSLGLYCWFENLRKTCFVLFPYLHLFTVKVSRNQLHLLLFLTSICHVDKHNPYLVHVWSSHLLQNRLHPIYPSDWLSFYTWTMSGLAVNLFLHVAKEWCCWIFDFLLVVVFVIMLVLLGCTDMILMLSYLFRSVVFWIVRMFVHTTLQRH